MARTIAELPKGTRITDYISLGVLTKTFPLDKVRAVVAAVGKTSQRRRRAAPAALEGAGSAFFGHGITQKCLIPKGFQHTYPPPLLRPVYLPAAALSGRQGQRGDPPHHASKQSPRQVALCQQQPVIAGVLDETPAGLHQPLL
jgi:hypothetical protein